MNRIANKRGAAARAYVQAAVLSVMAASCCAAHAVVVRGSVRDSLGRGIPTARVQLVKGTEVVASTVTQRTAVTKYVQPTTDASC